jgi:hypothetical protein
MDYAEPINPYHDDPTQAAFAGREDAFIRLHQHLTNPTNAEAILFLGRHRIGKTALLLRASSYFDDSFIDVYLPLQQAVLDSEKSWLLHLVRAIGRALASRDFTLSRLPEPPENADDIRNWFTGTYLAELFGVIRHRRLVFLLDDAEALLRAVANDRLPDDSFAYLQELLGQHEQLGMVLTLNNEYESHLAALSPLVNSTEVVRLSNLAPGESRWLLQQPIKGLYIVPDDSAEAVHHGTGGQPQLLQRIGNHLFLRWQGHPDQTTVRHDDVKPILTQVYNESEAEFKQTWLQISRNERLVLTAISSLLYNDPLLALDAAAIEGWLVETDYPMDLTAINSALRSLEYREIVNSTQSGVAITAGLMQTWLLDNARLGEKSGVVEEVLPIARSRWVAVLVVIAIILAVLLAINLSSAPQPTTADDTTPVPTVTLSTNE